MSVLYLLHYLSKLQDMSQVQAFSWLNIYHWTKKMSHRSLRILQNLEVAHQNKYKSNEALNILIFSTLISFYFFKFMLVLQTPLTLSFPIWLHSPLRIQALNNMGKLNPVYSFEI